MNRLRHRNIRVLTRTNRNSPEIPEEVGQGNRSHQRFAEPFLPRFLQTGRRSSQIEGAGSIGRRVFFRLRPEKSHSQHLKSETACHKRVNKIIVSPKSVLVGYSIVWPFTPTLPGRYSTSVTSVVSVRT